MMALGIDYEHGPCMRLLSTIVCTSRMGCGPFLFELFFFFLLTFLVVVVQRLEGEGVGK